MKLCLSFSAFFSGFLLPPGRHQGLPHSRAPPPLDYFLMVLCHVDTSWPVAWGSGHLFLQWALLLKLCCELLKTKTMFIWILSSSSELSSIRSGFAGEMGEWTAPRGGAAPPAESHGRQTRPPCSPSLPVSWCPPRKAGLQRVYLSLLHLSPDLGMHISND